MTKVKTKSIVFQNMVIMDQKQKGSMVFAYISLKKNSLKNLCSPMYSGRHITYIYTWYLHKAATRGLRSIHHQTGGQGVEVCSNSTSSSSTTAATRPSDILENPLPSQKRKGCNICGGLKQLPKLSAH